MTYSIWILICLLLIFLIFFQMPKENIGLTSFIKGPSFLGSATIADKIIKVLISLGILVYITLAFKLNNKI